eukprot:468029-Pyramimonas_sp.AAC.1
MFCTRRIVACAALSEHSGQISRVPTPDAASQQCTIPLKPKRTAMSEKVSISISICPASLWPFPPLEATTTPVVVSICALSHAGSEAGAAIVNSRTGRG